MDGGMQQSDMGYEPTSSFCLSEFTSWYHQMETFSTLLALCVGNSLVTGEFPSQRPMTRSFDVFFGLCLNSLNGWVNNRDAGDLGRQRAHYDVTVMILDSLYSWQLMAESETV